MKRCSFYESTAGGSNEVNFKREDLIICDAAARCFVSFLIKQLSDSGLLDSNKNKHIIQKKESKIILISENHFYRCVEL